MQEEDRVFDGFGRPFRVKTHVRAGDTPAPVGTTTGPKDDPAPPPGPPPPPKKK
jgi:hypothetical protein